MNLTRTVAAVAASVIVSGLGVATTSTTTHAADGAEKATSAKALRPFKVTAKINTTEPEQGSKIKIKGTVRPLRAGDKVRIEKRVEGSKKWEFAAKVVLSKTGKFKWIDTVDTVRFRQYRVVKNADENRAKGKSETMSVTVYGWRSLTSLNPVSGAATYETKSVNINAKAYDNSIVGTIYSASGSIAYNLERKCKQFESRVGVSDSTDINATGNIVLKSDATSFYANSFELTESAAVTRDVTGIFRITMDWTSTNTGGDPMNQTGAVVALGSPRVLCSF